MALPDAFLFSQGNLQDYVDCQRRFQLRHVLTQPWPAIITEPALEAERHAQRGTDLHHLAHQHSLEIDAKRLEATIHDEVLARWWHTYLTYPPPGVPETVRRAEVVVSAPLAGHRLVAQYDLLAVEPGERLVVVDWKAVLKRPLRANLARRLQTRVYRYLAVEGGAAFNGGQPVEPEQVEMIYWFAEFGGAVECFPYDADQRRADGDYLVDLIAEIAGHSESIWPLTPDERQCRFCNYRSLCERGATAAFLADAEDDLEPAEVTIDLEQIAEVAF